MKLNKLEESQHLTVLHDLKGQYAIYKRAFIQTSIKLLKESFLINIYHRKALLAKKIAKTALVLSAILFPIMYFIQNPNIIVLPSQKPVKEIVYIDNSGKNTSEFLHDLGYFESRCNYNPSGNPSYWGKYQIGRAALSAVGFDKISKEEFIQDSLLQEVAIRRLMKLNKQVLCQLIGKWEGKTLAGIYITQSGLLAAAHLGGCGNVKQFLESNGLNIFKDGNGTPITKYMKHFSNYKLQF